MNVQRFKRGGDGVLWRKAGGIYLITIGYYRTLSDNYQITASRCGVLEITCAP